MSMMHHCKNTSSSDVDVGQTEEFAKGLSNARTLTTLVRSKLADGGLNGACGLLLDHIEGVPQTMATSRENPKRSTLMALVGSLSVLRWSVLELKIDVNARPLLRCKAAIEEFSRNVGKQAFSAPTPAQALSLPLAYAKLVSALEEACLCIDDLGYYLLRRAVAEEKRRIAPASPENDRPREIVRRGELQATNSDRKKGNHKRNKRGRKPLVTVNAALAQRRQQLVAEWARAKGAEVKQQAFCNDKGIGVKELRAAIEWVRSNPDNAARRRQRQRAGN